MIFGRPNIARVMQLLDDGARLRVVARIGPTPFSSERSRPTMEKLPGYWRIPQQTGARSFPGDNHTARPFSHFVVSSQSQEYS